MAAEEIRREAKETARQEKEKFRPGPKCYTAADLAVMTFPEPKWAIPGILPEGLSILGGKPKQGKSIFALNIGLAIALGGVALGSIKVDPGDVLYLALEDTYRRLKDRIKKMQTYGDPAPSRLRLYTQFPIMDEGGREMLSDELSHFPNTRLVIIDTLKKFRPATNGNKQLYDADYEAVNGIKEIADKHGVCILIIHHLRKMTSDDPFDCFSGTLGLTGAADGLLVLRFSQEKNSTILHLTGRDVEPKDFAMQMDPISLSWNLMGDADDVQNSKNQQTVFEVIKSAEKPVSPKQISESTGLNVNFVYKLLHDMSRNGKIRKTERGKYENTNMDA